MNLFETPNDLKSVLFLIIFQFTIDSRKIDEFSFLSQSFWSRPSSLRYSSIDFGGRKYSFF